MGAYIRRIVKAGKVIEIEKYFAPVYGRHGRRRAPKTCPTPEAAAKVNEKNAINRLRWLINANFSAGDLHAVLTYRRDERPDETEARARIQKTLRQLRKTAKASGAILKYIHATEYKRRAIHHHMIDLHIQHPFQQQPAILRLHHHSSKHEI